MRRATLPAAFAAIVLGSVACSFAGPAEPAAPARSPSVAASSSAAAGAPAATAAVVSAVPSPPPTAVPTPDLRRLSFNTDGWKTDFSRHRLPLEELSSGGPPRDGIPPLDRPRFESVAEANAWLDPREPVVSLAIGGESRAYPLQILTWHEIVNDELGGTPVSVTF